jgi:hypothetical protein
MAVRVSSIAPSIPAAATSGSMPDRISRRSCPRRTIPATIWTASSKVWRVEPARKTLGVRATSSSRTRTAEGAVRYTSTAKRHTPASCSEAEPGPSPMARKAVMNRVHCSAKTLSSSSSLFWK